LGLNSTFLFWLQVIMEVIMFFIVNVVIRANPSWPLTHNIFLGIQCQVFFFKMHSYLHTNLELREKFLLHVAKKSKSPPKEGSPKK